MDDYLLIGEEHKLDILEKLLDFALNTTGFNSPANKRGRLGEIPTRWLGGHWKKTADGKILLTRPSQLSTRKR